MFTLKVDNDLELQLFQLQDSLSLYQLVEMNREHLQEWLPWVENMTTPFHFESIIPVWLAQFAENNGFNAGIVYKGVLVGSIGLHQVDWHNRTASIGYFLAKSAEGHGIMSRSVRALLNYAFFRLGLNRIEIRCGDKNRKSRAIPERLGFVAEGKIREGELLRGRYHDLLIYGMLSKNWKELTSR